jgi:hypothetical protein
MIVTGDQSAKKVSRASDPVPMLAPRRVPNLSFTALVKYRRGRCLLGRRESDE